MQLIFDSCSTMGYAKTFEYLGGDFCFRHIINLNLQGTLFSNNQAGVTPIWSGISGVLINNQDYQNILINGESFGSGVLNDISFDSSVDVRTKNYTASVTIYKTGDLSFLNNNQFYLSGTSGSILTSLSGFAWENIGSISESSSFSKNSDLSLNFQRSLSVSLSTGGGYSGEPLIAQAKNLATVLLGSVLNLSGVNFDIPTGFRPKRVFSESYDYINGSFSFNESINYRDQNPYNWFYSHSLKQGENGIVEVSENGSVIGVNDVPLSGLMSGYLNSKTGAYSRCSGLFSDIVGNDCNLVNRPVSSTFDLNHNAGSISYNILYSTNPQFNETGFNWTYSHSINKNPASYTVSEQGSIIGQGTGATKYNNAYSGYITVNSGVSGRVSNYFNEFIFSTGCFSGVHFTSKSISDDEVNGRISYSYNFSTDNRYLRNGVYSFFSSGIDQSLPIHLKTNAAILNDINSEYAISNYISNASLGSYTFVNSFNISGINYINDAIYRALPLIINTGGLPSNVFFLSDVDINFDIESSIMQSSVNYNYVGSRSRNNILI
jgi:hypothetical protein